MDRHHRNHLFYYFIPYLVIFLSIGHSHGIEVHTDDEVHAEYGESTTIWCSYSPSSIRNGFTRLLWTKGERHILDISDTDQHASITSGRYGLVVDYALSGNLTINDVQLDDEGLYACHVKIRESLGKTSVVNLRVVAVPNELILRIRTGNAPVIVHQGAVTLKPGVEVEFECEAIRSRPAAVIAWYIDEALEKNDMGTSTSNSNDARFQDMTSSFVITSPGRSYHGKSVTCQAMIEGRVVRNTSIVIKVEVPPDRPITVLGLTDHINPSTKQTPFCIASGSFPASHITWSLGGVNVTGNAVTTPAEMTSGMMMVVSKLDYIPRREDDGKILRCTVGHVILVEDVVAEKAICLSDSETTMVIEQELSTSLLLKLSGIPHSASCTLRTCETTIASSLNNPQYDGCTEREFDDKYSDVIEHEYEVRDILSSSTYEVTLSCRHTSCGNSTASAVTQDSGPKIPPSPEDENGWIRDLIFVIIAVIVVSAFVIVVTVSIVLRAVVKGSMPVTGAHEENHMTASPDRVGAAFRSSISSSMSTNLYTIEEGNEGEHKIYHEIKELRSSLVRPSDIIVSPTQSITKQRSNLGQSTRLTMQHPRPPPLPPPTHRLSVNTAVVTGSVTASDSSDAESEQEEYVPMSPDAYSIGSQRFSEYMTMSSVNTN